MEQLMELLAELRPDLDFAAEQALIDDKVLDSFDIISLVGELNEAFGVQIGVEHLVPENFNSATAMLAMIQALQAEQ